MSFQTLQTLKDNLETIFPPQHTSHRLFYSNLLKSLLLIEVHPKISYTLIGGLSQGFKNLHIWEWDILYATAFNMKPKTALILSSAITKKPVAFPWNLERRELQIWGNYFLPASVTLCCFGCLSVSLFCWIVANTQHSQERQMNIYYYKTLLEGKVPPY